MKTIFAISILTLGFAAQAYATPAFPVVCSGVYKNSNNDPMLMTVETNKELDTLEVTVRFAPNKTKPIPFNVTLREYQVSESMKGFPASYIVGNHNQNFPDGVNETATLTIQSEIISATGNPAKLDIKSSGGLAGLTNDKAFALTCIIAQ